MSCVKGINDTIEKILNNKPWFSYIKGNNYIEILESPKQKITKKTSYAVAVKVTNEINKSLNDGYKKIGTIVYPKRRSNGWGMIEIFPSEKQISLINESDETVEIQELEKQIFEENQKKEFQILKEEANYNLSDEGDVILPTEYKSIRTRPTEEIAKGIDKNLIKTKKELKYTQHITNSILNFIGDLDPNRKLDITPEQAFNKAYNLYSKILEQLKEILYSGVIISNKEYQILKNDPKFPELVKEYPILQFINSYDDLISSIETYDEIIKNFKRYTDFVVAELRRKGIKLTKNRIENNDKLDVANQNDDNTISDVDEIASNEIGERFDKSAFEIDVRNTASIRVKGLVQTIKTPGKYELGMPIYANPSDVFADVLYAGASMNLSAFDDIQTKYQVFKIKLLELVSGRPYLSNVIEKLDNDVKNNKWETVNDVLTFASKAFAQETLLTYEPIRQGNDIQGIKNVKVFDANRDTVKDQVSRSWINQHEQSDFFDKNSLGELKPNIDKLNKLNKIIEDGRTKGLSTEDLNKKFAEFFSVLGIKLTEKDMSYISSKIGKVLGGNKTILSTFAKNGMLQNIYNEYLKNKDVVFENNYGLTNEKSSMNELAKLYYEANPGMFIIASSKSADGKSKYLYIQPSYVEVKKREFENGNTNNVLNSALATPNNSFWKNVINKVSVFKLQYFNGIRERNRDGKVRKSLTDKEQVVTMFLKHQADLNTGTYINFTLSDKTTTIETKITKEFFPNSDVNPLGLNSDYNVNAGKIEYTDVFKEKLYKIFAEPEINRILTAIKHSSKINLENFDIASKLFYIIPSLNSDESLNDFRTELYNGSLSLEQLKNKYGELIKNVILKDFENSTEETIQDLLDLGVITKTKVKNVEKWDFPLSIRGGKNTDYLQRINKTGLKGKEAAKLLVLDMKTNYMNAQVKMIQYLRFDPYLAFKGKVKEGFDIYSLSGEDKVKMVNATWDEFSKRAAALIAPGSQGNYTWTRKDGSKYSTPNYKAVTVKDVEYKINNIDNVIADAQELVTMSEHIDTLMIEGRIPSEVWESITNKIEKAGKGGFYKLSDEELKYAYTPTKPVHVNDVNEGDNTGLNRVDYVKSSRYPLIPEHEVGSERDKLRVWMEKNDIRSANFKSGKKLGRPSVSIALFDNDGNFIEPSANDLISSSQLLSRDGLRTQQEIPHQKDEITNVSQLNRRIFDELLEEKFSIKELKNITGNKAKSLKEQIRSKQFNRQAEKLRNELGDLKESHRGLQRKLIETIKNDTTGSYGENDIRALELDRNGKFKFDFEFQFKSEKFQGLINSMVNNNVKLKTKGSSFIQVSGIGSKFNFSSLSKGVQSGIVWTKEYADTFKDDKSVGLKYIRKENGEVKAAQVIVSQYIKDDKGNLINLEDFLIKNDKGVKILDTSKFSKEMFQLIATRIPNQGLMSTLPIEVVGFLPSYMENTIIVPDGITGQMGSDFDVDKLYAYISNNKTLYDKNNKVIGLNTVDYTLDENTNLDNFSDEQLEQLYYDLHWMALTHPAAYDKITKSVDMPEAKEKVKQRKELLEKYNITIKEKSNMPLDFMKSIARYNDNRSGKTGVSIFASIGSAYADFQNKVLRLGFKDDNNQPILNPIKIKLKKDPNVNSYDIIELSHIGLLASAKSFVKTEDKKPIKRSIIDFINMMFTESVDNAKNQLLNEFNWNDNALGAIGLFQILSSEKNECVPIEFIMDLTSQNSIETLFKKIDQKRDSFGEFDTNAIANSIEEISSSIADYLDKNKLVPDGKTGIDYLTDINRDKIIANDTLANMWVVGKALKSTNNRKEILEKLAKQFNYKSVNDLYLDYYTTQYDSLQLFSEIETIGKEFMTILGAVYPYAKGIGPNVFATKQTLNQLNKLAMSSSFLDIEHIAGEVMKNADTGNISIVPSGEIGSAINNSLIFAQNEIYNKLFPISTGVTIEKIVDKLLGILGKTKEDLGKESYINNFKTVFNAIKSYLYTSPSLELFDTDLQSERKRLITDENSLAQRITKLKTEGEEEFLRNGFLKNIEISKQYKSNIYDIKFRAPLGDELDEKDILSGFYELATHSKEEVRQLAKDLAIYPFLTGDAGMIGRFIPVDYYMSDKDFSDNITKLKDLLLNDYSKQRELIEQIVQNNPEDYAKTFKFSTVESSEGSNNNKFKNAFKSAIKNVNTLEDLNTFSFKFSQFDNFDSTNNTKFAKSFQVPLTKEDELIAKKGSDGGFPNFLLEKKYPDYIMITDMVSYEQGEESKEINYLYKRVSPLSTSDNVATYKKIPILGHGNIKEYSFSDSKIKSIIKNNNVLETEESVSEVEKEFKNNLLFTNEQYEKIENDKSVKDPSEFVDHTGGANLSDTEWDQIGREFGVVNHNHYREPKEFIDTNGQPAKGSTELDSKKLRDAGVKPVHITQEEYNEGAKKATAAFRMMFKDSGNKSVRSHYIIRNWMQVKNADAIYALGTIKQPGENASDKAGETRIAVVPLVKGGTGYAVQMAINEGKPVYVFDGTKEGWYKYDYNLKNFVTTETPRLTKNFAGIGSRSLSTQKVIKKSIQAIIDVYNKTFGEQPTSGETETTPIVEITTTNYTKDTAPNNSDVGFIFTENAEMLDTNKNVSMTQAIIRTDRNGNKNPNALPIITKKKQESGAQWENTNEDFNEFVRLNTELINRIKSSNYKKLVFPPGFATDKAKLPTRFAEWLQKVLLDNFGLVTELNDTKTGLISKSVSQTTSVEDFKESNENASSYTELSYKNTEFLYDEFDGSYYYKKGDGSQGAQVIEKGLLNKLNLQRNVIKYPERVVVTKIGPNSLSYFVTGDEVILSLQDSTFGDKITDINLINKILFELNNKSEYESKEETIISNQNIPSTKTVVVPKGSNPNNEVIFETADKIYLMNDGQQEAYVFIKNKVQDLLKSRQVITASSLDSKIAFDDPLSKKFSGVIPAEMWNNMIGLAGRGGVGKTTVIKAILDSIQKTGNKYNRVSNYYLTPSHTPSTVLQESLGRDSEKANDGVVFTVASMVRKKPNEKTGTFELDSEEDYLNSLKYRRAVGNADIIIVDESSMITINDINDITKRLQTDLKNNIITKMPIFIFMGDYRQLGPINEQQNPLVNKGIISSTLLLNKNKTKELTQVMRSDNELLHQIYDSIGKQIIINTTKTQEGEEPIRLNFKEYDKLTNQSTKDILVVDNEEGIIDDYTNYLSNNNNPAGMFWIHYNNVDNAKTKNMSKKIRQKYFEKIGEKPDDKIYREFSNKDYVIFTDGEEIKSDEIENYKPNEYTQKIFDKLKMLKNSNGNYRISPSYIKPQSRFKVIDIYKEEVNLFDYLDGANDLKRYLSDIVDLKSINLIRENVLLYTRQNTVRAVKKAIKFKVSLGNYNIRTKKQENIIIKDFDTGKIILKFDLPYGLFKNNVAILKSLSLDKPFPFKTSFIGSSHTAQGNSIKNVIVGEANIRENLNNPVVNQDDVFSSLYVGLTRTSGTLTILKRNNAKIHHNQEVYLGAIADDGSREFEDTNADITRLSDFEESLEEETFTENISYQNFDEEGEYYDTDNEIFNPESLDGFNSLDLLFEEEYPNFINKLVGEIIPDGSNQSNNKSTILNSIFKKGNEFNRAMMAGLSKSGIVKPFSLVFDVNASDPGHYNSSTKTITINPLLAIGRGDISESEGRNKLHKIFMHELMHHVLADILNADPKTLSSAQKVHVQGLKNLFEYVKDKMEKDPVHAESMKKAMDSLKSDGFLSQKEKTLYYGLTSVHEFASMLFEDEGFREFMNNQEYAGKKSIIDRFIDILVNLFKSLGIVVKNDSVLKEGLSSIIGIIESTSVDPETELKSVKVINKDQNDYINRNFDKIINILNIKSEC